MSDMVTVEVSTLEGPALDWAVATAKGYSEIKICAPTRSTDRGWVEVRFNPEPKASTARFDPSENWAQGGPIIEREKIETRHVGNTFGWRACLKFLTDPIICFDGPTPLIAAMRCYVTSRFGNVMKIPADLAPAPSTERRARP